MKKWVLAFVFFVFIVFLALGDTEKLEEIDFLLFLPDSSSLFVNEEQAMVQLDNLAKYLMGRELIPGQIYVYGYAAFADNDIESIALSRDRALLVINELRKRGVPQNLFSAPVGYGSVDLWGGNTDEEDRISNRRVRVVLGDIVLAAETRMAAEPEIKISGMDNDEVPIIPESIYEKPTNKSSSKFPWWILFPLAFLADLIFFVLRKRKRTGRKKTKPEKAREPTAAPAAASESVKPIIISTATVNLEEEIRFRAYERYLLRNGQSENEYEDWCIAVIEICAKYEADGYQAFWASGNWWARKSIIRKS